MPYLERGYARIFYAEKTARAAAGALGVTALLIHGWMGRSEDWWRQLPGLKSRCRTIVLDLRGHGRSSAPDSAYTHAEFLADIVALLEYLAPGPVVAMGHSLGGTLALRLGLLRRGLVHSVIAIDPGYGGDPSEKPHFREWADGMLNADARETALRLIESRTEGPATPAFLRSLHRRRALRTPPHVIARTFHEDCFGAGSIRFRPETDQALRARDFPTLTFFRDRYRAEMERSLLTDQASEVVEMGGCGHWIHQERPLALQAIVETWLHRLPGSSTSASSAAPRGRLNR